jgi:hypothetical protein
VIRATHSNAITEPTAAAPVAARPVAKPAVPQQAKRQEGLVHLDALKSQIKSVAKHISSPAVRLSFQSGNLKEQKEKMLTFVFSSKFHFDKMNHAESIVSVEQALKTVTGQDLKVRFEFDAATMAAEHTEIDTLGWETHEEAL